jgi:hypothetical protein
VSSRGSPPDALTSHTSLPVPTIAGTSVLRTNATSSPSGLMS